jgi:hypothetical protein
MHGADWVVVIESRHSFEQRAAVLDLDEREVEQIGNRRRGQTTLGNRLEEA